jgi:CheY-like chemotaxis protein
MDAKMKCLVMEKLAALPGFDGLSALAFAKQKHPEVPFILCSGHVFEEKKAEAEQHGAIDYVSKNDLAGLISLIKSPRGDPDGGDGKSPGRH